MLRLFYVFLFFKGKGGNGKDNPQWDSVGERCMTDGNRRGKAGLFLLPVVGVGTVLAQEMLVDVYKRQARGLKGDAWRAPPHRQSTPRAGNHRRLPKNLFLPSR